MTIKHASGISPEELSLLDAAIAGQRAGVMGLSPSLNPYAPLTPEAAEWERMRMQAQASWLANFG